MSLQVVWQLGSIGLRVIRGLAWAVPRAVANGSEALILCLETSLKHVVPCVMRRWRHFETVNHHMTGADRTT